MNLSSPINLSNTKAFVLYLIIDIRSSIIKYINITWVLFVINVLFIGIHT